MQILSNANNKQCYTLINILKELETSQPEITSMLARKSKSRFFSPSTPSTMRKPNGLAKMISLEQKSVYSFNVFLVTAMPILKPSSVSPQNVSQKSSGLCPEAFGFVSLVFYIQPTQLNRGVPGMGSMGLAEPINLQRQVLEPIKVEEIQ